MSFSFVGLTPQQVAALPPAMFAKVSAAQMTGLTLQQIQSLTPAQVSKFSAAAIKALAPSQFDALSVEAIGALSAAQLVGVRAVALNGLSSVQLEALDATGLPTGVNADLTGTTLNAFTTLQLSDFSRAQVQSLTKAQIGELSSASLAALNPKYFDKAQVGALSAAYFSALSVQTFDQAFATRVASLSVSAIAGLCVRQIESMSVAAISEFSVSQFDAMNSSQQRAVLAGGPLIAEAKALEVKGMLTFSGMLKVLQTAAIGGMNAIKFGELSLLASELGASCGIPTSAYVQAVAENVINGNSANAYWHGGSSTKATLGDLTASSSQTQMERLIGKWFLGTDLPSLSVPASIGFTVPAEYQPVNLPLFGPGGPSYHDVNQGNVGDGYFLAALAETAFTDPALIKNMIHENANGTFAVCFQIDGGADYITVNNELPVMLDQYKTANGSALEFANSPYAWSLLIEKAYVQLVEQSSVTPGYLLGVNGNAYADIAGGDGNGISAITGDRTSWIGLTAGESSGDFETLIGSLQTDLSEHWDVLFASSSLQKGIGNLVNNQMFEVLGVNIAAQSVLLQNPWNGSGLGSGKRMQFWESLGSLAKDSHGSDDPSGFYVASAPNEG